MYVIKLMSTLCPQTLSLSLSKPNKPNSKQIPAALPSQNFLRTPFFNQLRHISRRNQDGIIKYKKII